MSLLQNPGLVLQELLILKICQNSHFLSIHNNNSGETTMKIVTAFTEEADLPDEATAQIRPNENLLSHSLGIVHCHPDFFWGDTLKEIAGAFGFPWTAKPIKPWTPPTTC
jgi:hypothetical protein